MSFSITNNSANAVVTGIDTLSQTYGSFTITSGAFPLLSGQTISGTNTAINNLKGSPYGSILIFLQQGDAQIELYINGTLYSALDYSSGIAEVRTPILASGDVININIDEADLPVPSSTPAVTSSPTPTPSVTPTGTPAVTPTMTPTPTTPVINPNTLSALWWLDYSDPANVSGAGVGQVQGIKNNTGAPAFSADTGAAPGYFSTAFNGVSGATATGNRITSLQGDYPQTISAYTTFFFFSAASGSNVGAVIGSDNPIDYSGNSQGYRWFQVDDYAGDFVRTYTFFSGGTSTNPEPQLDFTPSTWTAGATRVYQSGTSAVTECWISNVLTGQTLNASNTLIGAYNPIFQIGGGGSPSWKIAEAFFFDYKLSDSQMGQMFQYLSDKY